MNGFEMSGKNDGDLWEAIIHLGLNRSCRQMLKTELEANMVNSSKDDPSFPYLYVSIFRSLSIFQAHFPNERWKTSLL